MNIILKTQLLYTLYSVYDAYTDSASFACRKGCSSCCTQSVNITALEGRLILDNIREQGKNALKSLSANIDGTSPSLPSCTTNQFAGACLAGKELNTDRDEWSFAPCIFLNDRFCSIYPVRPFICRSFASTVNCDNGGTAELPTSMVSLNSMVMQIVEHIDQGNIWGNMIDVMAVLLSGKAAKRVGETPGRLSRLLVSEPSPGFLIPPEDERKVTEFITLLFEKNVEGRQYRDWLFACS